MSQWHSPYAVAPPQPPPPRSSGALLWGLVAIVGVLVLGAVITLVVVITRDEDSEPASTSTSPNPPAVAVPPTPADPSPSQSPTVTGPDLSGILSRTVRTGFGSNYKRAEKRAGSCGKYANSALRKALRKHPCKGTPASALYATSSRKIEVTLAILPLANETAAKAVSKATRKDASVKLIRPGAGSGLPKLRGTVRYWTQSWPQGRYVVYAVSYRANGREPGGRSGAVMRAGRELGVEIKNVLLFRN